MNLPIHPPTIHEIVPVPTGASAELARDIAAWNKMASDLVGDRLELHRIARSAVDMEIESTNPGTRRQLPEFWGQIRITAARLDRRAVECEHLRERLTADT